MFKNEIYFFFIVENRLLGIVVCRLIFNLNDFLRYEKIIFFFKDDYGVFMIDFVIGVILVLKLFDREELIL